MWRYCPEAAEKSPGPGRPLAAMHTYKDGHWNRSHSLCGACVRVCVFNAGQSTAGLVLNAHSVAPVSRAHSPVTWWAAVGVGDVFTLHAWLHPHKRLGLITHKPFNPFC